MHDFDPVNFVCLLIQIFQNWVQMNQYECMQMRVHENEGIRVQFVVKIFLIKSSDAKIPTHCSPHQTCEVGSTGLELLAPPLEILLKFKRMH